MSDKPKLALYWASSCGGCEIAVLAIHEKILDVAAAFDIVFWPCVMDFKEKDVEAMADQEIDVCLFNGAIRNDDNERMAKLMRQKSKVMVAFGSCASEGCMPGLANFTATGCALTHVLPEFAEGGLRGLPGDPVLYVSEETHHSFEKNARILGLGRQALAIVSVDTDRRMEPDALREEGRL